MLDGVVVVRTPDGEQSSRAATSCASRPDRTARTRSSNRSEQPARIVMFSSSREPAVAVYPDSDKIGVWPGNDADQRDAAPRRRAVDYYDGERYGAKRRRRAWPGRSERDAVAPPSSRRPETAPGSCSPGGSTTPPRALARSSAVASSRSHCGQRTSTRTSWPHSSWVHAHGPATARPRPAVAPLHQRQQRRDQVGALLGQPVLVALGALLVDAALRGCPRRRASRAGRRARWPRSPGPPGSPRSAARRRRRRAGSAASTTRRRRRACARSSTGGR